MQAAFHQELGFSTAYQFHRLRRGGVAVRHVDNANLSKMDRARRRDLTDLCRRADENGDDQSLVGGLDGAGERRRARRDAPRPSLPDQGCDTWPAVLRTFPFQSLIHEFLVQRLGPAAESSDRS